MLVLAFDTATPAVTAAVHDGTRVLAESTTIDARRHGELLAPAIETVLREAGVTVHDVTAVVAGAGPGPYTGLRVGLITARALSTTLGVPAYGICTLDAIAYAAGVPGPFTVITDARRKELFWATYADGSTRLDGPRVDKPADVPVERTVVGARLYLDGVTGPEHPSAGALAALAAVELGRLSPEEAAAAAKLPEGRIDSVEAAQNRAILGPPVPIYLRRPDAQIPGAPKKVTA
ncbi:tRNA (adenosine(37)-N6)-threonylcarbamoyltransferase complex dimerization subunit type 1 TsaB [Herbidospora cretacea]|uniref:tRNA (adenosine(37)-N6)-threonylcarbamoyltransferase complex dimerization subunit type 1 TsaB n=1 Tax=Herbidospora cretacea TaxID=28444 RepID=UPI0004C3CEBE|nr:tRNA (adenosine(37)-N6)-threonylcarbamoyltransferase complex dimerization subunit type 1 TsaB [Herbidospora cretacea]